MTEVADRVEPRLYRIGEVAKEVGVTARTIRYYEELGLLEDPGSRLKGTHRLYGDDDIARLRELVRLRDLLGLSLDELTELADVAQVQQCLRAQWDASTADVERARIIAIAIANVERQLALVRVRQAGLTQFEAELTEKLGLMRARAAEL